MVESWLWSSQIDDKKRSLTIRRYNETIKKQRDKDIIEEVESVEVNTNNRKHFIHHGVIMPEKICNKTSNCCLWCIHKNKEKQEKPRQMFAQESCYLRRIMWTFAKIPHIGDWNLCWYWKSLLISWASWSWWRCHKVFACQWHYKPVTNDDLKIYRFTGFLSGIILSSFLLEVTVQQRLEEKNSTAAEKTNKE